MKKQSKYEVKMYNIKYLPWILVSFSTAETQNEMV